MRVVITGGAGFLGSHLCRNFLERGDEVVAVDNLCTGLRQNIAELEGQPGFDLVLADVSREIPVSGRIDGVLHFASPASREYLEMPLRRWTPVRSTPRARPRARTCASSRSTSEIWRPALADREDYNGNVDPTGLRAVRQRSASPRR
jgi:dTDP-glucose 4,6-dehydratase